jgi:hypothetical protein
LLITDDRANTVKVVGLFLYGGFDGCWWSPGAFFRDISGNHFTKVFQGCPIPLLMDRKRIMLAAVALLAALTFYTIYDGTITYWDGVALEVDATTELEAEQPITLTPADLQANPDLASALETASNDDVSVIDEYAHMTDFVELMETKGADTDAGYYYYIESDGAHYLVTYISYGGVYGEPIYMYLAGLMLLVAIVLAVTGIRR